MEEFHPPSMSPGIHGPQSGSQEGRLETGRRLRNCLQGVCITSNYLKESAGLAGVSSEMGLDDGLLVCTLLLLI